MDTVLTQLTVYFENPFWVGVIERRTESGLEAARLVFGAEPKDYEVYRLLLERYADLRFSAPVEGGRLEGATPNPKRMQREAARKLARTGAGTKAQQALKLQREQNKAERKTRNRAEREAEAERKFQLRQDRQKQKHKGR